MVTNILICKLSQCKCAFWLLFSFQIVSWRAKSYFIKRRQVVWTDELLYFNTALQWTEINHHRLEENLFLINLSEHSPHPYGQLENSSHWLLVAKRSRLQYHDSTPNKPKKYTTHCIWTQPAQWGRNLSMDSSLPNPNYVFLLVLFIHFHFTQQ